MVRASRKELFGWCMFDFANSSYTTVIITVVFGPIFTTLIVPASEGTNNPYALGNSFWALALGLSYVIVALVGPLFGAITDLFESKKSFLFYSYLGCVLSTASLWFVKDESFFLLAFGIIIASNFCFSLSENFVSSFLPFLGSKEELGRISGYAWAIGYFGGMLSVILVRVTVGDSVAENFENLRWVGPLTACFFLLAGIPTFLFLKEPRIGAKKQRDLSFLRSGYARLIQTFRHLSGFKDLSVFLVVLFFSLAALSIIIGFTFIYGRQEIGLGGVQEAIIFVLTNLSAAAGAFIFGWLQDRLGALKTFMMTLGLWIASVLLLFYIRQITHAINQSLSAGLSLQAVFTIFAVLAGLGLGATQSAGRTLVALFSPENRSGEFFGLWGVSAKAAAAMGLFAIAGLQNLFGLHNSLLVIVVFFSVALILCFFVNEKRGIQNALLAK